MRSQLAAISVRRGDSESVAVAHEVFQQTISRFGNDTRAAFSPSRKFFCRN
jgi:hypothetical protein